jgi:hypothetical protein
LDNLEFDEQIDIFREINNYAFKFNSYICRVPIVYDYKDDQLIMEDVGSLNLKDVEMYKRLLKWNFILNKSITLESKNIITKIKYNIDVINMEDDYYKYSKLIGDVPIPMEKLKPNLDEVANIPNGACYKDFQILNIMINDNCPYVIDIQYMCLGQITYDVATLLHDTKKPI